jgi:hypothetical protein
MDKMINKIYPFLSIGVIEVGQIIEHTNTIISIFIFLIQLLIGILTILKLYKEIKINKSNITDLQIENEVKKKNRFLIGLLGILKNFKLK